MRALCVANLIAVLIAVVVQWPAMAGADDGAARAKDQMAKAARAFNLGKFKLAAEHYEKAYEAKAVPAFLFNIAQCHKRLGGLHHLRRAKFYFESYLANTPDAPNKAEVDEELAQLKPKIARLEAEERAKAAAAAERKQQEEQARKAASTPPAIRAAMTSEPAAPPPSKPLYKKWWFWTAIGVAVVGGTVAAIAATTGGSDWTPTGEHGVFTPDSFEN